MSGTSLTDKSGEKGMIKVMGMVICSLILLTLFIISMARLLGNGRSDADSDPLMRNALVSRIEPVGAVRTSAEDLEQVAMAGDGGGATRSGEELVQGVCAGCHAAGAAGAPMLGDEEAWAARREQGLDALVASVVNGKGSMPAKGGSDYSDEEIRLAVQHIAMFPDAEGGEGGEGGDAPVEASATTMTEEAKDGERPAAGDVPSGGQVAPADAAAGSEEASGDVADEAVAEDVGTAGPSAEMGPEELAGIIATGHEPEGLTDAIKAQVDGVCAGCHAAGVAGAPKTGDEQAWGERAEQGLAALSQSVINGKGAMPPRGGSTLSDEEVPIAIQYQMGKSAQ